jgi:hypothetical protein
MLVPSLCPHCKIKIKDLKTNTEDLLYNTYNKRQITNIKIQTPLVIEQMLQNNILRIMPKLNAEKIKFWIQESYIENPN